MNVPRSNSGISSPSSDSLGQRGGLVARRRCSTATASEVIAVSVFAPGPWLRGPGAPGVELGAGSPGRRRRRTRRRSGSPAARGRGPPARRQLGARGVDDAPSPRCGCSMNSSVRASITAASPRATGSVSAACAARAPRRPAVPRTNSAATPSSSVSAERNVGRRRLGLRALQVRRAPRRARRARSRSRAASRSRSTTHGVAARRREHQLRGDPLGRGAELVRAAARRARARARAARRAARRRPRRGRAGGRSRAARRRAGSRPARARRSPPPPLASSTPASAAIAGRPGLLAQHRDRPRHGRGGRGQPGEPQQHGPRHRARADRAHRRGVRGVGATCSAASAVSSWRSSSGLPAVTSRQAAANAVVGRRRARRRPSRPCRPRSAAAAGRRRSPGPGRARRAAARRCRARRCGSSSPTSTGSPAMRRAR